MNNRVASSSGGASPASRASSPTSVSIAADGGVRTSRGRNAAALSGVIGAVSGLLSVAFNIESRSAEDSSGGAESVSQVHRAVDILAPLRGFVFSPFAERWRMVPQTLSEVRCFKVATH
eukprot:Lankesteria_metandrocarpae@DN4464_c0_g1_i1.p1